MITTIMYHYSSYVEFTHIFYTDVFQRTQLPCVGSGVQVGNYVLEPVTMDT